MDNQLEKHVLPVLGDVPLESVNETRVQEFVADLKGKVFERYRPDGTWSRPTGFLGNPFSTSWEL